MQTTRAEDSYGSWNEGTDGWLFFSLISSQNTGRTWFIAFAALVMKILTITPGQSVQHHLYSGSGHHCSLSYCKLVPPRTNFWGHENHPRKAWAFGNIWFLKADTFFFWGEKRILCGAVICYWTSMNVVCYYALLLCIYLLENLHSTLYGMCSEIV